ncbi:hypothetical protein FFI97_030505 [Variovorax sp. KBS0712]|nr:hypothetical protein FFI97_030505 [Variovorax sp. KBS0712]
MLTGKVRALPRLRAVRVAFANPLPGATPAARQSRFRGVPRRGRDRGRVVGAGNEKSSRRSFLFIQSAEALMSVWGRA